MKTEDEYTPEDWKSKEEKLGREIEIIERVARVEEARRKKGKRIICP